MSEELVSWDACNSITWAQFKRHVDEWLASHGATDQIEIGYIDFSIGGMHTPIPGINGIGELEIT